MPEKDSAKPAEKKEKVAKTRPMPLDTSAEFTEWAKGVKTPEPDDKGQKPPEAPEDTKEPREHGADKPDEEAGPK